MPTKRLIRKPEFSDYRDKSNAGNGRTVAEALELAPLGVKHKFNKLLQAVTAKANRHEQVNVYWWYAPFVYVEVKDTRWKHYPCGHRFLVSFDVTNGLVASKHSTNQYSFARKGWRPFADKLTGYTVARYSDCGHPENTPRCW